MSGDRGVEVVDEVIAVVLLPVADLGVSGEVICVVVIAVGAVSDVAGWLTALVNGRGRVAEAVHIGVEIPGGLSGDRGVEVVDEVIAVVLLPVADLGVSGEVICVVVIAVGAVSDVV